MKHSEHSTTGDAVNAQVSSPSTVSDSCFATGRYDVKCYEYEGGPLLWEEKFGNKVDTEGINLMLDTALAGSSYSVTGPYFGLISSVSWSAVAATDTAAQINGTNGWKEAGTSTNYPDLSARQTASWSSAAAGAKATSSAASFTIGSTGGTLKGAFLIYGPSASTTLGNTSGKLMSAGTFSGGDQVVSTGNVVTVSYTLTITPS